MRFLSIVSLILMVVGALNWLLVGLVGFNLVTHIFGSMALIVRIVYIVVGLAGVFGIAMLAILSESHNNFCVPGSHSVG